MYPQLDDVVVVVEMTVVELVDVAPVVDVVGGSVELVGFSGAAPHPTRAALTMILSKRPPIVVAAPPKLSTPKPIQSRDCGKARPVGTFDPMPLG